ncbi:hypothetical protein [Metasolibacillus sp.]|uniref:hypothetical protein n=1 Tax=Metasolibacillus sp. TaxID=2703680 RepID=UPI0025CD0B95|nr:hypothetical protein [Metasolibacillus sp.]MCT6925416.1 hypothetical protein [Metasolibacillus sp.]MCT6941557.1 hypothetical protein [Metasolibacillus sp.]
MKKLFLISSLALLLGACGDDQEEVQKSVEDKEEVEEVAKEEKPKENKELTYYEAETKIFIDEYVKKFDSTWNNIWVIVMDRAEKNDISTQDAYTQIQKVHDIYREMSMDDDVPVKQLSKENKKLAKEVAENLSYASVNRQEAAKIAMEVLETNSSAKLNEMNEKIQWSDEFVQKAVAAFKELESNLYTE